MRTSGKRVVWDLLRPLIGEKGKEARELGRILLQVIRVHFLIASELLERKVFPHVGVLHGISTAINSRSSTDINLALFEILGRIGMGGLWVHWHATAAEPEDARRLGQETVNRFAQAGLSMIRNNPALLLPITDRQATDVTLFLLLCLASEEDRAVAASWLEEMARLLGFTIRTRGRYPSTSSDYRDIADHPRDGSDEYFKEATAASTLIPLIMAWLEGLGCADAVQNLATLAQEKLAHTTMQSWMPDETSEARGFAGHDHGRAICDLPVYEGGAALLRTIAEACRTHELNGIACMSANFWPVLLVACRHYQLPVPPHFWIDAMVAPPPPENGQGFEEPRKG